MDDIRRLAGSEKDKMKRYVFEFEGTVTPKSGEPFQEKFFVVAVNEDKGKELLSASNPKVPDLTYTGSKHLCNRDWEL